MKQRIVSIAVLCGFVILAFLLVSKMYTLSTYDIQAANADSTAIITDVRYSTFRGSTRCYPIYKMSINGQDYEHESILSCGSDEFELNQEVPVKYEGDNPSNFYSEYEITYYDDQMKTYRYMIMLCGILVCGLGIREIVYLFRR